MGKQELRVQRGPHYISESRTDVQRCRDKREKLVTMVTLVLEGASVLNSSSTKDFASGNREPQKLQGNGSISCNHFIQCSAPPAISPIALVDNPHLQQSDSSGSQWLWELPQCLQLRKSKFRLDSPFIQSAV